MITNTVRTKDSITITQHGIEKRVTGCTLWHRILKALGSKKYADDLITDAGLADIIAMIADRYNYISVGTGNTAPDHTDTGLENESMRVACTKTISTTFYTNDTVTFRATFIPQNSVGLTEIAINKNETSSGDVTLARETFSTFNAEGGVAFDVAYTIVAMR